MKFRCHRDLIQRLGGARRVAAELRVPFTTAYSWHQRDSIPVGRWPQIIDLARRLSVELTTDDLLRSNNASCTQDAYPAQDEPSPPDFPAQVEHVLASENFHEIEPATLKQAVFEAGLDEALAKETEAERYAALDHLERQVRRRVA